MLMGKKCCAALEQFNLRPESHVTNGHILEVVNRCTRHQRQLTRCAAQWTERTKEKWDCGACEWNVYCCVASLVCIPELRSVLATCELPEDTARKAADCPEWGYMMRCLYKQGLFLRWDGQRDCRTYR
ncbi:unnamed protein product [Cladocopium goreaui]|uniref:Uncharacterized protein n=1 Tax=Cladocopium goreaui TaxID=2562237 RepID=A0A9P1GRJ9_9DINO|nr:unnamed protein product [Cladocopium goreaui]